MGLKWFGDLSVGDHFLGVECFWGKLRLCCGFGVPFVLAPMGLRMGHLSVRWTWGFLWLFDGARVSYGQVVFRC